MIETFQTLSVMGDNITEEDKVVYLLASLPRLLQYTSDGPRSKHRFTTAGHH